MPISVYFIVIIILAAPALVFFVKEKIRLEKAKKNLAGLLKNSEEERAKAEAERDITKTVVSSFCLG